LKDVKAGREGPDHQVLAGEEFVPSADFDAGWCIPFTPHLGGGLCQQFIQHSLRFLNVPMVDHVDGRGLGDFYNLFYPLTGVDPLQLGFGEAAIVAHPQAKG
jgi:hypothetical protein